MKYVLIYYLCVNLLLFLLTGLDKSKAKKNKWRIPESQLFYIALFGGAIGGFVGMFFFHHKTKKIKFYIIYLLTLLIHIALIYIIISQKIFIV